MNKHIQKIQRQAKDESLKAGLVILGAVGGLVAAKLVKKFTENKPTLDAVAKYAIPALLGGGGFILAAATDDKSKLKYLGYGLTAAGAIETIKAIPAAKDYFGFLGILGETEIPAASAFYTEQVSGLEALPMGNAMMQEAARSNMQLPDLEGFADSITQSSDLSYNVSFTDDVDSKLNGII